MPKGNLPRSSVEAGFALGALVTLFLLYVLFGIDVNRAAAVVLPAGCAAVVLLFIVRVAMSTTDARSGWNFQIGTLCAAWFAGCAVNSAFGPVPSHNYGDDRLITLLFAIGSPYLKALLPVGVLHLVHDGLGAFMGNDPEHGHVVPDPVTFFRVTGFLVHAAGTAAVLRYCKNSLAAQLCVFTPLWLLFGTGYVEVYPFIVWTLPLYLHWLFATPLAARSPYHVGVITALVSGSYLGFAPFAALGPFFYLLARPKDLVRTGGAAFLSALVMVLVFYRHAQQTLPEAFVASLNLGDANTLYAPYLGKAFGPHSTFFSPAYALSLRHGSELAGMIAFGLGILTLLAALIVACIRLAPLRQTLSARLTQSGVMETLLLGWSVFYVVFMIPKLGPRQDIDLFFPSYVCVSFLLGRWLEGLASEGKLSACRVNALAAFLVGGAFATACALAFVGVPELAMTSVHSQ